MTDPVLHSLLRINRMRLRALRKALAPYEYVGIMHLIMRYVAYKPGASQDEIACFYTLDKASVARDARKLEELGHIRRIIDPNNRRKYQMYLTEAGEKMMAIIDDVYERFAEKLAEGVSSEDWQQLQRVLKQLEENSLTQL